MNKIRLDRVWEKSTDKLNREPSIPCIRSGVFTIRYNDDVVYIDVFITPEGKIKMFLSDENKKRLIN